MLTRLCSYPTIPLLFLLNDSMIFIIFLTVRYFFFSVSFFLFFSFHTLLSPPTPTLLLYISFSNTFSNLSCHISLFPLLYMFYILSFRPFSTNSSNFYWFLCKCLQARTCSLGRYRIELNHDIRRADDFAIIDIVNPKFLKARIQFNTVHESRYHV